MGHILVVDDETDICRAMSLIFSEMGHTVHMADNIKDALEIVNTTLPDIAFFDLRLGQESGIDLLKLSKKAAPDMTVLMISAFGSVESVVQAMKIGAYDYICKPFNNDEIKIMVNRLFEHRELINSRDSLQQELDGILRFESMVGASPAMKRMKHLIKKVLHSKANVLLTGETGTGKSLAAHIIHHQGPRKDFPLVTINCGAIPENLLESELFGHSKGAFTGAIENKTGLFVKADKGSLFLDEVSELPLKMQVKLLNVIQTKELTPVGSTEPVKIDVRIIAASNTNLAEAVQKKELRKDLFYRLNVVEISVPPLRECRSDIPQLVHLYVDRFSKDAGRPSPKIPGAIMISLQEHSWPGNVRELENIIERAVLMCDGDTIEPKDISLDLIRAETVNSAQNSKPTDLKSRVSLMEKEYIQEVLARHGNNKEETARFLNINIATLYRKLDH
ncbi:Response regulator of zinc sigma-54-dependent two-component system [hydrothermal vent metagenome]|uniref:Response regulator of zinc sigma-54-dependent two-component system n=1 Tax=hydrothermal vent metagenome TaxID=652676 RepID=A0A3B1C1U5_9ZZZZ